MNLQYKRNETKRLLDIAFNSKEGVVKINKHNCFRHELAKFLLCWEANLNDVEFITEAVLSGGGRPDVLILDSCEAWEVLDSETDEMFKKKIEGYPFELKVLKFDAEKVIKQGLKTFLNEGKVS